MKKSNIALIGFRATGKTNIGQGLAAVLQREFIDMDDQLTRSFGQNVQNWVRAHGWKSFREAEAKLLEDLAGRRDLIVATGGGVVEREGNRAILKKHFFVIWLKASPETVRVRLLDDREATSANRPSLTDLPLEQEIAHLLQVRSPLYKEPADVSFATDDVSLADLIEKILEFIQKN